jgi:hypothetical protein
MGLKYLKFPIQRQRFNLPKFTSTSAILQYSINTAWNEEAGKAESL